MQIKNPVKTFLISIQMLEMYAYEIYMKTRIVAVAVRRCMPPNNSNLVSTLVSGDCVQVYGSVYDVMPL